jgi:plasmid stabilization system protein ParE
VEVEFTWLAQDDLDGVFEYIARDNPVRAMTFVEELTDEALKVGRWPDSYAYAPGFEEQGIRHHNWRNYIIFYRADVDAERVTILRVLHGARDWASLL